MPKIYDIFRPIIYKTDPEWAHDRLKQLARIVGPFGKLNKAWNWLYSFEDEKLEQKLWNISFKNPVGLAAGFDKDASMFRYLDNFGFGFIEAGTVTHEPQAGNPKPRMFRLKEDKALINRMGFNNPGANVFAKQLTNIQNTNAVKIVNIGKSKVVPNDKAIEDYLKTFKLCLPHMQMCVVNVSSPNTPGLRELQGKEALKEILQTLQKEKNNTEFSTIPLLVKIAPDLNKDQLTDVLEVVKELNLDGIVATNTSTSRDGLRSKYRSETGGLSGRPIADMSTKVIAHLYKESAGSIPIIGVGGIFTPEDAYEKIKKGASLIEVYTGLVYKGPSIATNIKKGLAKLLEKDGFDHISQAIGVEN